MHETGKMYAVTWMNFGTISLLSVSEVLDRERFEACLVEDCLGRRLKLLLIPVAFSIPFPAKGPRDAESVGSFFGQAASMSRSRTAAGIDHVVFQVDLYSKWLLRVAMQSVGLRPGNILDIVFVDWPGQAVITSYRITVTPELCQLAR